MFGCVLGCSYDYTKVDLESKTTNEEDRRISRISRREGTSVSSKKVDFEICLDLLLTQNIVFLHLLDN